MTNDVDTFNTIAGWPMARLVEPAKRGEKEAAAVALELVRPLRAEAAAAGQTPAARGGSRGLAPRQQSRGTGPAAPRRPADRPARLQLVCSGGIPAWLSGMAIKITRF